MPRPSIRARRPCRSRTRRAGWVTLGALFCWAGAAAALGADGWLAEVGRELGLDFVHDHGGSGQRYMVETMGSGIGWLDFDGDGWLDIYFAQGAPLGEAKRDRPLTNRLYRNLGGRRFEDVTARAGVGDTGYGQGVAVGDYDRDGDPDLYVVNFGPNVLYRNDGDGRFTDVTELAGVGDPLWGSSAAFGDLNADGWPDLFVTNYLEFTLPLHVFCGDLSRNIRSYCPPDVYEGVPDRLYFGTPEGRFRDVSRAAGVDRADGKGLGVVLSDLDGDHDLDVYVANDMTPNFFYRNDGRGGLTEDAVLSGAAYGPEGGPQAGMGVDSGDADGDGDLDLVTTNFYFQGVTLYRNDGGGFFDYGSAPAGLLELSLKSLGFGISLVDLDNDGALDLLVGNGHIMDNIALLRPEISYAQPPHLFRNQGSGDFTPVDAARGGSILARPLVVRSVAPGDFNNDGAIDLALGINNGPALLLAGRGGGHAIEILLRDARGAATPVGARVIATTAGRRLVRELKGGGSYQSAPDQRLHLGLGSSTEAEIEVVWLGGERETLGRIEADRLLVVRQGSGIVSSAPLSSPHH